MKSETGRFDGKDAKQLGLYIQKHRKAKGYTQQDLADLMNLTPKSICFIERGINYPTPNNIFKLAEILDMSLDEFVFSYSKFDSTLCIDELNIILSKLNHKEQKMLMGIIQSVCTYMLKNRE